MDQKKKPKTEISQALAKMELEAAKIEEQKRISKRKKKPEMSQKPDRQEIIKEQNNQHNREVFEEVRRNGISILILLLSALMLGYSVTKEDRTTVIEYAIYLFLFAGMIASRNARM